MTSGRARGIGAALASAALFGASTPLAKGLLAATDPFVLAGLLYLGSGLGLSAWRVLRRAPRAAIPRAGRPWLAAAVGLGGVAGPALLMAGLARTDAATASLLLNAEGVLTALLAWVVFRENVDARIAAGMAAIAAGAVILSWEGAARGDAGSALLVVGACACWALDNNLTRKVSLADPIAIAAIKGLVAGPVTLSLALLAGARLPGPPALIAAGAVGLLGYGVSLSLFVVALRELGAARAGAYFSTAPFVGAVIAVAALGAPLTPRLLVAGALMGLGTWLHVAERHEHEHRHEALEHEHAHRHDDGHHDHEHSPGDPPGEPHVHAHRHSPLTHRHAHYPDAHHRHEH